MSPQLRNLPQADAGKLLSGTTPDAHSTHLDAEPANPPETPEPTGDVSENAGGHDSPEELLKEPEEPLLEAPEAEPAVSEPSPAEHESLEHPMPAPPKPEEAPYVISMPGTSPANTEEDKPTEDASHSPPDGEHRF